MRSSSHGNDGSFTDCEPAAMIAYSKRISFTPSFVCTSSSFGETNVPTPSSVRTLRCFAIEARPPVSWPTTLPLKPRSLSMSIFGAPKLTPCAAIAAASSITAAACSSALDGMQPTLRQTPPRLA